MLRFPVAILKLLICTTLLFAVCPFSASAQVPREKLERLADEIQKVLDASPAAESNVTPAPQPSHSRILLNSLRSALERDDLEQAESALQQLSAYLESAVLRADCAKTAAQIRALREAKEKQTTEAVEAAFNRATESIRSAKKPSDLDATILELKKLRLQHRSDLQSSRERAPLAQVEPAIQFVNLWQDFLAQSTAGDAKAKDSTLDRILGITQVALLPRSEILARRYSDPNSRPPPPPPTTPTPPGHDYAEILSDIKTPQELMDGLGKLIALSQDPHGVSASDKGALQHIIDSLSALAVTYREFEAGMPTKLEIVLTDPSRREPFGTLTASLRAQMITLVLPRYLGLPKEMKAKPDEGPIEFLQRVIQTAAAKGDFALAVRARDAQILVRDGKTEVPTPNSQGGNLFVVAQNQELAGQFNLAVTSYEKALASGMDVIPPKIIGDRLAQIKKEHPAEFAQGLQEFLTPRMVVPPPGFENYMNQFQRPPGPPRRPGPPQRPALDVPGETPSHSPTPSPASSKPPSNP